jgi:hypothetical protein
MRCFEVEVTGERYWLAGVGDVGALSAFVTYVGVRGSDGGAVVGPTYLSVSGFSGSVDDQRHLHWREGIRPLVPGDVTTLCVLEAESPDPGVAPVPPALMNRGRRGEV